MNAYVTVNGVKMTKLYPEGGAEAPPVADAAKICWRPPLCGHTHPGTKICSRQVFLASLAPY